MADTKEARSIRAYIWLQGTWDHLATEVCSTRAERDDFKNSFFSDIHTGGKRKICAAVERF